MKKRRYVYLNGTEYKTFTNFQKMIEWAKDEKHDGKYYCSATDMTWVYTREQVLNYGKFEQV